MRKRDVIEGRILREDFPAKGVLIYCDEEGREIKVTVRNALEGQSVSCVVTKVRGEKAEGRLLQLMKRAPFETDAPCPHFARCGGCHYLTYPYARSVKTKEDQVKRLLFDVLAKQRREPAWLDTAVSPKIYGYRNKMEFTFGDEVKGGVLSLGMHAKGSFHDIVTVTGCVIADSDYSAIIGATLRFFSPMHERGDISFYHRYEKTGTLRHLLVRKAEGTGEILVDLVTTSKNVPDLSGFVKALCTLRLAGTIVGILHTKNDAASDAIIDEGTEILYGRDHFFENILGLNFLITPFSFFQTNSGGAGVLYSIVRDFVSKALKGKRASGEVFDLYCGTGTITQMLAKEAAHVTGVEIVEEAVSAARENARRNGITNVDFICGDVLKVLDTLDETPEMIVIDPPREGLHNKALPKITERGAAHIIYVSCKPTSLARDLTFFLHHGYEVRMIRCMDEFPWTVHCEVIVSMSRAGSRL